jgi:putative sigma-54 modulation protein
MNININSVRFDADKKLLDFTTSRIEKLGQFFEGIINAEVFLKLENTNLAENKIAEIKIEIPHNELFAKKQCKTFEEAVDESIEALRKQLLKYKGKLKN